MDFSKYHNTLPYRKREDFEREYIDKLDSIFVGTRTEFLNRLKQQFAEDLAAEFGVHESLGGLIFHKAWDEGHADGLQSVYGVYEDLVDFVERIIGTEQLTKGVTHG